MDTDTCLIAVPPSEFLQIYTIQRNNVTSPLLQNYINSILNDTNGTANELLPGWIPENIKSFQGKRVQVKLLCGADLLESFAVPGLWNDDDVRRDFLHEVRASELICLFLVIVGSNFGRAWTRGDHTKRIESRKIHFRIGLVDQVPRKNNREFKIKVKITVFFCFQKNITIVTNWVPNEVSSTMARRHLSRGLSVKYMLDDVVVDYIRQNGLYGASET